MRACSCTCVGASPHSSQHERERVIRALRAYMHTTPAYSQLTYTVSPSVDSPFYYGIRLSHRHSRANDYENYFPEEELPLYFKNGAVNNGPVGVGKVSQEFCIASEQQMAAHGSAEKEKLYDYMYSLCLTATHCYPLSPSQKAIPQGSSRKRMRDSQFGKSLARRTKKPSFPPDHRTLMAQLACEQKGTLLEWPRTAHNEKRIKKVEAAFENKVFSHVLKRTYLFKDLATTQKLLGECEADVSQFSYIKCNELEHIVYEEVVEIIDQSVYLRQRYLQQSTYYLTHFGTCCALEAKNQASAGSFIKSFSLLDLGWSFLDYSQAVAEGVACGLGNGLYGTGKLVYDVGYLIIHPQEIPSTARHLAYTTFNLIKFVATLSRSDIETFIVHKWNTTAGRDLVKETAQFLTEWFLPPTKVLRGARILARAAQLELKALDAARKVSGLEYIIKAPAAALLEQSGSLLRAGQKVQTIAHEVPFIKKMYNHVLHDKDFLAAITAQGERVDHFFEDMYEAYKLCASKRVGNMACPIETFWEKILSLQNPLKVEEYLLHYESIKEGVINLYNPVIQKANGIITDCYDLNLWQKIIQSSSGITISLKDLQYHVPTSINVEHIFMAEAKVNKSGKLVLTGLHHDYQGILQKSKIINFDKIKNLGEGFYQAEISCMGIKKTAVTTFFPQIWDQVLVLNKIHETLKNPSQILIEGDRMVHLLQETSNVAIKVVKEKGGKIITAYPTVLQLT
jgi:hypothetical protein